MRGVDGRRSDGRFWNGDEGRSLWCVSWLTEVFPVGFDMFNDLGSEDTTVEFISGKINFAFTVPASEGFDGNIKLLSSLADREVVLGGNTAFGKWFVFAIDEIFNFTHQIEALVELVSNWVD